jgi:hypothetical protein
MRHKRKRPREDVASLHHIILLPCSILSPVFFQITGSSSIPTMISHASTMIPDQRAAISLNNTGVELLQRRCYHQGMSTLKDAVALASAALVNRGQGEDGADCSRQELYMEAVLHQAAQRLAKPEPRVSTESQFELQILSDYQSPAIFQEQQYRNPSTARSNQITLPPVPSIFTDHAYLLRIDALDFEPSSAGLNLELQSSILLLNLGIAYRCMADLVDEVSTKNELQVGAMRIFAYSYSVLMSKCETLFGDHVDDMDLQRLLLATILVLQNLVSLTSLLERHELFQEYTSRLDQLQHSSRGMRHDWSHGDFSAGAA